ncbi:chemotaxis protein CheA [Sphingomonas sp. AP4-R1]|uniref:chemotaxis protein CheA n=1 Tax=Sphingomonas sp. AP4-R1 TaxID=2735134 RepID=UPI0014935D15|nr:chemotaxis protein CheW [Sphingomonas sp. AP4-R1]QJU59618.1 chemotaxis protein CheA [Sphingomonas sp. AP4-R1]
MDDLLTDFIAETRETLDAIAGELVAWEADPGDRTRLDSIFRFVHTVKGSCGFLDLPRLLRLSHAAEDALAEVRDGARIPDCALVSAVLAIIDRIGELTDAMESGESVPDGADGLLIAALAPGEAEEAVAVVQTAAPHASRAVSRSIRLPVDLLDRMMAGVSDMVLARNELSRALRLAETGTAADVAFERLSQCVAEVRDAVTRTRMARIDGLFSVLPRMVRDLASQLGRTVQLDVDGGDVELDREMIEMIRDPLTHIVRNAIDHGIETPDERVAAGKSAVGRLRVSARQSGNQILIDAIDDGRGIDADRVVQKALTAGLVTAEQVAGMNWQRKLSLIFLPGLSTANAVSDISGRGVGMDVVRANIERIGGMIDVDSKPGQGVRLTLRLPLTLTIIPALIVGSGDHHFAVPRSAIEEIVRAGRGDVQLQLLGGALVARIRGRSLPVIDLGDFLGCEQGQSSRWPVLVVLRSGGGEPFALLVDAVLDHEELVVKPAAPAIMATGIYAGTTLPDNSRPILLFDVAGLAASAGVGGASEQVREEPIAAVAEDARVPTLLFRDLDGVKRGVRLGLVERIEDVAPEQVSETAGQRHLAHQGLIAPLIASGPLPTGKRLRVLQLGDGQGRISYAIDSVIDVVDLASEFTPLAVPGPIAGITLQDDEQIELLDAHWLFASRARTGPERVPVCLISDDRDPWSRQFLEPVLAAAGYRVLFGQAPERDVVDVVIGGVGSPDPCVRLRAAAEPGEGEGGSIWRYDRASLLDAVAAAARRGRA